MTDKSAAADDPDAKAKQRAEDDAVMERWVASLTSALTDAGLDTGDLHVELDAVLGLAGHAAHAVLRPAAPLTTFVVGYAAGRAAAGQTPSSEAVQQATATALQLTREYRAEHPA
ncbi:DUF6457 domain-containing protein [Spelaeicoccus albus]|uniref:DUF6457 domain-containing protein n=1 Tax=Spelaeicoccus albus TaxID=1280376 RepID=A0A7Z0D4T0_9MICO|nr:DUF6457 domain-containing protein [Spelaeicoccus albus]NYI68861.1 hypothetical protein [Spelaeicoccus albus]